MKVSRRLAIFNFVLALGLLEAQNPPLSCTAQAASTAPTLRKEGITEQVSDIVLLCTGGTPTPAGQTVPTANLRVFLNTSVTSRPLFPGSTSGWTEGTLLMDDPAPGVQNPQAVSPASGSSFPSTLTGNGTGLNFGSGAFPNVFPGRIQNVNALFWQDIPVDPPGPGKTRSFRITNVRANAFAVTQSAFANGYITATLNFNNTSDGSGIPTANPILNVGFVQDGMFVRTVPGRAPHCVSYNAGLLSSSSPSAPGSPSAQLIFTEGNRIAFRPAPSGPQNIPGTIYNSEAGFFLNPPGVSNSGTRLKASFTNIPQNVFAFVNVPTGTRYAGAGTALGSSGLFLLNTAGGNAEAIWEVTSSSISAVDSFTANIYFAWISNGLLSGSPAAPTRIAIGTSFDSFPVGPGNYNAVFLPPVKPASTEFLIFSCTGAPPQISGTIDTRPCTLGANFPYAGNSCSAGNAPFFSVGSDSGILNNVSGTFPPAGPVTVDVFSEFTNGLGSGILGTSPPFDGFFIPKLGSNPTPGTYQANFTFGTPGASNFTLPFTFNVLSPTTPILLPTGLTDAVTYESGAISPGQIFTVFCQNCGNGNLTQATLDSQGRLSNNLGGSQVFFDTTAAPMLYTAPGPPAQWAGLAPFNLAGKTSTQVRVVSGGVSSPSITVPVFPAHIAVMSANATGGGPGVIFNANGTLNTAGNPAAINEIVVFYISYGGPLTSPGIDGQTTTAPPYPKPTGTLGATIGGVNVSDILYFGNVATGVQTFMQVNLRIPVGVTPGSSIPVTVTGGGATSPPWVTIAVKP